jgi:hypothetical protein
MLSEKGLRIEQAINNEWAKSHIYCPLNYARIAAQAVLALERPAEPEPTDTYSMAQPSPLRYVPMVTAAGTVQQPAAQEPTFTLEQVRELLGHMRLGEAEGIEGWRDMKLSDRFNAMLDRRIAAAGIAPKPQEQVTVSKNSVLIDGDVCATFSGKDSLDAAQDYARLRIARLAELAKEASNG